MLPPGPIGYLFAVFFFFMLCFVVLLAFWFFYTRKAFKRLRTRHHRKWVEMGRPALFANQPIPAYRYMKFVYTFKEGRMDDPEMDRIGVKLRVLAFLHLGLMGILLVLLVMTFALAFLEL